MPISLFNNPASTGRRRQNDTNSHQHYSEVGDNDNNRFVDNDNDDGVDDNKGNGHAEPWSDLDVDEIHPSDNSYNDNRAVVPQGNNGIAIRKASTAESSTLDDCDDDDNDSENGLQFNDDNGEDYYCDDEDEDNRQLVRQQKDPKTRRSFNFEQEEEETGESDSGDDYHLQSNLLSTVLSKHTYQYLYPPNVPRAIQLYRWENLAIPACYLLVGVLQGFSGPFTNVYPLDLNASEAQQATISSLKSLPSTFKLAFGFLSDNVPLCGYRRKSYMLLGWLITSLSMWMLLLFSDLRLEAIVGDNITNNNENMDGGGDDEDSIGGRYLQQQQQPVTSSIQWGVGVDDKEAMLGQPPSIPFLSFSLLLFGTGFWFADVMGDSIVAEKAKLEPESSRGHLQSTCYACRFFGLMMAAPLSTVIYSTYGPKAVVILMAILPATIVPLVYSLKETKNLPVASTREQCSEIWNTVCSRAVWQPMGFVYLFNVLQVGNAAWKQFLKTVLGFTSNQLNTLLIAAYVLLWLGIMAYKKFFIKWSWRTVYIATTLLNGLFSSLQILLIKGQTFGMSPFLFALGDDSFDDFLSGIQFLPTTIMMVNLCPTGSEGSSYAMFTTVHNSASTLSGAFSTLLLGVWDVSKDAMEKGQLSGMINLTWLTTFIQISGLLFVNLLPRTKEDLDTLHADPMSGSKVGGSLFLLVTFASILYSLVVGVLNIVKPGWAGES